MPQSASQAATLTKPAEQPPWSWGRKLPKMLAEYVYLKAFGAGEPAPLASRQIDVVDHHLLPWMPCDLVCVAMQNCTFLGVAGSSSCSLQGGPGRSFATIRVHSLKD